MKTDTIITDDERKEEPKRPWADVFDNIEVHEGPGDNIYVYG